jgi:hypothetical protein
MCIWGANVIPPRGSQRLSNPLCHCPANSRHKILELGLPDGDFGGDVGDGLPVLVPGLEHLVPHGEHVLVRHRAELLGSDREARGGNLGVGVLDDGVVAFPG